MFLHRVYLIFAILIFVSGNIHYFNNDWGRYDEQYGHFPESQRLEMLEETRQMFAFGYDNYMKHAFPKDELDPIHCTGRGPDYDNPSNININDVLGDYALTLVDTLDTLVIMGNSTEFKRAVQLVIDHVSFDKPNTVQVFEATIRMIGGLLASHLLIIDVRMPFGELRPQGYDNELLSLAHDLAARLLPAFEDTATGIPHARVNLQDGVPQACINETCTAGAGSLLMEFGMLSRLLGDPVYENLARRAVQQLWSFRSNVTGLLGNVINIHTGEWIGRMSGVGAGLDSFYEYLLKAFILFGEKEDLKKFNESYETVKYYMRRGRKHCNDGEGHPPLYVNVNMKSGELVNNWVDALQAAWPGVQVLKGDIEEAICSHAFYYALWQRYGALPERYNWYLHTPEVLFYPLRPELVESTYLLYQATKNPFYLHVGRDILRSLNNHTRVECGYATVHDVNKKDLEDRMESFFLSETCKYLYLLFDKDNHINQHASRYLFTTEGHLFPVHRKFRRKPWLEDWDDYYEPPPLPPASPSSSSSSSSSVETDETDAEAELSDEVILVDARTSNLTDNCEKIPEERQFFLPIKSRYLDQLQSLVGLH